MPKVQKTGIQDTSIGQADTTAFANTGDLKPKQIKHTNTGYKASNSKADNVFNALGIVAKGAQTVGQQIAQIETQEIQQKAVNEEKSFREAEREYNIKKSAVDSFQIQGIDSEINNSINESMTSGKDAFVTEQREMNTPDHSIRAMLRQQHIEKLKADEAIPTDVLSKLISNQVRISDKETAAGMETERKNRVIEATNQNSENTFNQTYTNPELGPSLLLTNTDNQIKINKGDIDSVTNKKLALKTSLTATLDAYSELAENGYSIEEINKHIDTIKSTEIPGTGTSINSNKEYREIINKYEKKLVAKKTEVDFVTKAAFKDQTQASINNPDTTQTDFIALQQTGVDKGIITEATAATNLFNYTKQSRTNAALGAIKLETTNGNTDSIINNPLVIANTTAEEREGAIQEVYNKDMYTEDGALSTIADDKLQMAQRDNRVIKSYRDKTRRVIASNNIDDIISLYKQEYQAAKDNNVVNSYFTVEEQNKMNTVFALSEVYPTDTPEGREKLEKVMSNMYSEEGKKFMENTKNSFTYEGRSGAAALEDATQDAFTDFDADMWNVSEGNDEVDVNAYLPYKEEIDKQVSINLAMGLSPEESISTAKEAFFNNHEIVDYGWNERVVIQPKKNFKYKGSKNTSEFMSDIKDDIVNNIMISGSESNKALVNAAFFSADFGMAENLTLRAINKQDPNNTEFQLITSTGKPIGDIVDVNEMTHKNWYEVAGYDKPREDGLYTQEEFDSIDNALKDKDAEILEFQKEIEGEDDMFGFNASELHQLRVERQIINRDLKTVTKGFELLEEYNNINNTPTVTIKQKKETVDKIKNLF